ncbi:catalase family peroxidase [Xanthomonas sp. GPE 39]|uniref:catalase family peroxidase n=1 Tax=Xanthomonas sp. GPE 39 TaxID=1583099 RepID=UPI0005F2D8E2|nr:catalase family peroxidase [Xanthomonas sp. GPE 39]
MSQPDPTSSPPRPWLALAGIAAIAVALAAAFAWSAGWLGGPQRLTAQHMTDALQAGGPAHPGFRRAHSKGVCVSGHFESNGQGQALSEARVFAQASVPVLGRLSIGGGDPHGADGQARVRSMALQLRSDDGQEWRMAMNNFPFFVVATPEGFMAQIQASTPDPATGKPDPAKMAAFLQRYPEAHMFQEWAMTAPWSNSWANTEYNGVNAFRFTAADGSSRYVRWSMRPHTPFMPLSAAQRAQADANFLSEDLQTRLKRGPLRWDLVLTMAAPGDPIEDPSRSWPPTRQHVVAGTLVLDHAEPQASGPCRDLNYDPLILPHGIAGSNDPILAARSAVYAQSFNRREREIARGQAPDAIGQQGTAQ